MRQKGEPMSDLIERQAAIDALADMHCKSDEDGYVWIIRSDAWARIDALPTAQPDADAIHLQKEQAYMQGWEDGRASIVQPSLYGYDIAHLAVIAAVMEKEGVTPEKAVQIFGDIQAVCQKVVDEIQERVAKAISSAQPERKKGKWITHGPAFKGGYDWMHCSVCKHPDIDIPETRTNFCSWCGADMRED